MVFFFPISCARNITFVFNSIISVNSTDKLSDKRYPDKRRSNVLRLIYSNYPQYAILDIREFAVRDCACIGRHVRVGRYAN